MKKQKSKRIQMPRRRYKINGRYADHKRAEHEWNMFVARLSRSLIEFPGIVSIEECER